MSEIGEAPACDQTESLRLLQDNELWLFLAPPGAEPNVANARVCADENERAARLEHDARRSQDDH
jgi:hypothetical protein